MCQAFSSFSIKNAFNTSVKAVWVFTFSGLLRTLEENKQSSIRKSFFMVIFFCLFDVFLKACLFYNIKVFDNKIDVLKFFWGRRIRSKFTCVSLKLLFSYWLLFSWTMLCNVYIYNNLINNIVVFEYITVPTPRYVNS